jgi:hypothetical protein
MLLSLLGLEALMFVCEWRRWLPVGWPVLVAVAAYALAFLSLVAATIAGLAFRWRLCCGIRSLLLLAAVGIAVFSWLAAETKRAKLQAGMVKTVDRLGGMTFDDLTYFSGRMYHLEPPEPQWATVLMGYDFFRAVPAVSFGATDLNDAQLAEFVHTPGSERILSLGLQATKITDSGFAGIRRCTALQDLAVQNTAITDDALPCLYPLSKLEYLDLRNTGLTDEGVKKLQKAMPKCRIMH